MRLQFKYPFVFIFIVMCFAESVHAVDGKSYPGSMCAKYAGSGNDITSTAGMRNNSATTTLKVICPVVKDQNGIKFAKVNVIDPGTGEIRCRVLTHFRDNAGWKGQFTAVKSSSNGDPSVIEFNNVNQDAHTGSHSYIRCDIPKKLGNGSGFRIISYHVTEW